MVESELGVSSTFSMTFKVLCLVENLDRSPCSKLEILCELSKSRVSQEISESWIKPKMLIVNDEIYLLEAYAMQLGS